MHLLARDLHGLDDAGAAVDLEQTPADVIFLSFSDSELALLARLHEDDEVKPYSLRCASLAQLKHPFSIDLYLDKVARHARLVVVRLLGGKDYWPYGVEQLAAQARMQGVGLVVASGDGVADARLDEASTLDQPACARVWSYFQHGGAENLREFLRFAGALIGRAAVWREPSPVASAGYCLAGRRKAEGEAARVLLVFYRSAYLAGDIAPITALADALAARGVAVEAAFATSLKEPESAAFLTTAIDAFGPDVIVNLTAFSARGAEGSVLDRANAPVLQAALATSSRQAWASSKRGASGADLAMNVVLPEVDGRIFSRAISFKAPARSLAASEFEELRHAPEDSRVAFVAELALNWARLRRKPNAEKSLALILSDYPARLGRSGYAIGLDAEASAMAIVEELIISGYDIGEPPGSFSFSHKREKETPSLIRTLEDGIHHASLPLDTYNRLFAALPEGFADSVLAAWGAPERDRACRDGAFHFSCVESGRLVVAMQPDRGLRAERRETYHDVEASPRHAYIAFYLWLRHQRRIDAMIHLGAHGTLEWLPGKSVMLSEDCGPEVLLGATPLIYPFIVNNPGEAAQAKRRAGAVTIGHLTPPLTQAQLYDDAARLEQMLDEYANAATLDPRRAKLLAGAILDEASRCGLSEEGGVGDEADSAKRLAALDAWLCDMKELRIGDGLHVFGRAAGDDPLRLACAKAERAALLGALAGRFVEPGPAGAPSRGRTDVLPTGRNLYCIDPRHAPTQSAYDIGRRAAQEVMIRYAQEHGDYPRRLMLNLWGSATIRTGGEDFAQALALLGVVPRWDAATARVSGFEIEPLAKRDFPRVDVTLHISGLFRDMFPGLIALFHDAANAVAMLDEDEGYNPLARHRSAKIERIFGAAPGAYGLGLSEIISRGAWESAGDLGAAYLEAGGHAYDRAGESAPAREAFAVRVKNVDALVHAQDMAETDVLTGAPFAEFEGGFASANRALGGDATLFHLDVTRPESPRLRSLRQEIARVLRGRLANPHWLRGQMRHGHRGAAEIAEAIDNLFAFSALGDLVGEAGFDLAYDATLGQDAVREFLLRENPRAYKAIARVFKQALERGLWRSRRNSPHRLSEASDA
jgi:cobaltochelatase CobN